jgi:hypothetical protein
MIMSDHEHRRFLLTLEVVHAISNYPHVAAKWIYRVIRVVSDAGHCKIAPADNVWALLCKE